MRFWRNTSETRKTNNNKRIEETCLRYKKTIKKIKPVGHGEYQEQKGSKQREKKQREKIETKTRS